MKIMMGDGYEKFTSSDPNKMASESITRHRNSDGASISRR